MYIQHTHRLCTTDLGVVSSSESLLGWVWHGGIVTNGVPNTS
jgi:hypothetical protein